MGCPFPPKSTIYFVNVARILSEPGQPTGIYAGAIANDKEQGVLFVQNEQLDPAPQRLARSPVNPMVAYLTPGQSGRVTLTDLSGKSVEFITETGCKR